MAKMTRCRVRAFMKVLRRFPFNVRAGAGPVKGSRNSESWVCVCFGAHRIEGGPMNTSPRRFLLAALSARATFHTYQIQEVFSNADGTVQYVVLHEAIGANGQNLLGQGHALT